MLTMFDICEIILCNVSYLPKLKRHLFSLSMFDYLDYCTRIAYGMLKILHGALIISKKSKTFSLYVLGGSTIIRNMLLFKQFFYDKTKLLRLMHVTERCLVELANQGLLGDEKLNKLEFYDYYTLGN